MTNIALCTSESFDTALTSPHSVVLSSYILGKQTEMLLEQAAKGGAHVQVVLSGAFTGQGADGIKQANQGCVERLKAAGVDAVVSGEQMVHLKAAVLDGVAYFDDCNWTGKDELLISDTQKQDISAVDQLLKQLMQGTQVVPPTADVALGKRTALQLEAAVITSDPGTRIDIETETLGPSTITRTLAGLAAHSTVRLLVAADVLKRSHATLAEVQRLQRAGVEVRTTSSHEKFAVTGANAWLGSANASATLPNMLDWGAQVNDQEVASQLDDRFAQHWEKGKVPELV